MRFGLLDIKQGREIPMAFRKMFIAAAVVAAAPMLAQAQPVTGLYIGGGVGANWQQDTTLNGAVNNALGLKVENEFEVGYAGVLSLGWGFGNGLRAEIEGNYRSNDVSDTRVSGASFSSKASGTGTAVSYGAMANILYDFN
ncbi:MAG: hypothetical protein ING62_07595, partial [Rhodocyclaceae bacterium]|nr:hypothetical protein [Rhodocyclaceae bacterium]